MKIFDYTFMKNVEVRDKKCACRPCYWPKRNVFLECDVERSDVWICATRKLNGCPQESYEILKTEL